MDHDTIAISASPRLRAAMIVAVIADALQIVVFPLFIEGAISPADDVLDFCRKRLSEIKADPGHHRSEP